MVDNHRMRVAVDDIGLFFDVDGCGLVAQGNTMVQRPVLVLLHGGPGADHTLFKPEFSAMTDTAQVIYLDQRGSGRSDRGSPEQWTWQRWADDVAGFCRAIGVGSPVLVGSSSGGMVAMLCAATHPGLVAGLVLDSALGVPTTLDESLEVFERRGGPLALEAARAYLGGDTGPAATKAWQEHGLPLYAGAGDGQMQVRRARALINDEVQAHFRAGGCGPTDLSQHFDAITCPTLILAGEDDPVSPAAAAKRLALALRLAPVTLEIFPNVGHGVLRQAPEAAFAALRSFLGPVAEVL
jgi:proline iminopeptidase